MSKELTRYGTDIAGELGEWPDGEYVRYSDYAELEAELAELQHNLKNWGTIEIAIRNPAVAESMRHWECRAEKAEDALKALTAQEAINRLLHAAQEIRLDFAAIDPREQAKWLHLPELCAAIDAVIPSGYRAIRGKEGK